MKSYKKLIILHGILIVLEIIALAHDIRVFGAGMFRYYTIDSNVLQLFVSACILIYLARGKEYPSLFYVLHLVCAVCLTVTFLIAAFVLAPQEGFAYYFLSDVAPINHFLGPVFSVGLFIFTMNRAVIEKRMVFVPAAASLLYGLIALGLNAAGVLDGPYFFLKVNEVPAATIVMWFLIIAVMCVVFSAVYILFRRKAAANYIHTKGESHA